MTSTIPSYYIPARASVIFKASGQDCHIHCDVDSLLIVEGSFDRLYVTGTCVNQGQLSARVIMFGLMPLGKNAKQCPMHFLEDGDVIKLT